MYAQSWKMTFGLTTSARAEQVALCAVVSWLTDSVFVYIYHCGLDYMSRIYGKGKDEPA
jgi:hypothetical protein